MERMLEDLGHVASGPGIAHVRTLIPAGKPFPRSALTGPAVAQWLATRTALAQSASAA